MAIYRGAGGAGDATADSASEALLIRDLAAEAQVDADAAAASAAAAAASASTASTQATNAGTSASTASTQATNAATSASSATTSASTATTQASNASTSATAAAASASSASTSATTATTQATNASTSASAASTSATAAASSASTASTQATNAATSASGASTSATNAANSATSASGSASTATTQASNASTSATNAASSATSASGSASTATTQAGLASTSATNAASSASAASTSASNASTSATNASNSATTASTAATNAASAQTAAETARDQTLAAYDNFDDRYLGAKTSDPTVDNDGNALVAGALYFNSSLGYMKVYTGSAWVDAYAAGTSFLAKANNLSDLANTGTARTNLGLAIGTNVQAWDADLDTWATKTAPSGTVVGISDTQTLTNKSISGSTNTLSNIGNASLTNSAITINGTSTSLGGSISVGTVTSVTGTAPISSTGGATPAISLAANYGDTQNPYASKTANYVLAAPNGSSGAPTFRAIVAADIPTLNQNTTGSAGSVANALTAGTGLTATATYNGSAAITFNATGTTINSQTAAYVLVAGDAGKTVSITTGGVTVNNSVMSAGNIVTIYNNSGSSQTITQGTGVTLQWAGQASSTTGNRTLALYGMATILFLSASSAVITGSGLT